MISEPWTASGTGPGIGGFPIQATIQEKDGLSGTHTIEIGGAICEQ